MTSLRRRGGHFQVLDIDAQEQDSQRLHRRVCFGWGLVGWV